MSADNQERIENLMQQKNFLSAVLLLQESQLDTAVKHELLGRIAEQVVTEIDATRREQRERRVFLRSLLQMIFREVPGLAAVYRDQVRAVTGEGDPMQQMYKNVKNWSDVASGRKSVRDGMDDTAESVRQGFEEAGESVRNGEFSENFRGFLNLAEQGFRAGLKSIDEVLRGQSQPRTQAAAEEEIFSATTETEGGDDATTTTTIRNVEIEIEED